MSESVSSVAAGLAGGSGAPKAPRVLVVDDEADLRELLELTLVGMGLDVDLAADLAEADRHLQNKRYALCLTDMRLPDGEGLSLVTKIRSLSPDTPVAVITAYGNAENAVAALKAGAFDYLSKPVALDALRNLVKTALKQPAAPGKDPRQSTASAGEGIMLGDSPQIVEVRSMIRKLARSMAPVHIHGESGSGKELAARMIHESSARADKPFIAVNCGAIPETLMDSEFFGYKKGAFTGAVDERGGFFHAADGGTLFLDEVADLPLAMQVKLLRAIQEKRVRRVGSTQEEPVDVRIVSATHQKLADCVAAGRFRQDLFYRLNVIELTLPSLRDRREDIPMLAQHLLEKIGRRMGQGKPCHLATVSLKYLQSYDFPGNVRELENILERAVAFANGDTINVEDLGLRPASADALLNEPHAERAEQEEQLGGDQRPASVQRPVKVSADGIPDNLPDYLDQVEREIILKALEKTGFNRTAAAKILGVSFRALRYRMQRLSIS